MGASAIAQWGYEHNGKEGLGDQPRFTNVTNNVCHVIGIYQKQSSCFFQAVSTQSYIHNNIFYNMPRAGVNFNDGFGGGHDLGYNMIWYRSCRKSSKKRIISHDFIKPSCLWGNMLTTVVCN